MGRSLSSAGDINGVVINGALEVEMFGKSVSATHDINNDGIDDIVVGAPSADINSPMGILSNVGKAYVFYGSSNVIPSPLNLSNLSGIDGMIIQGVNSGDSLGKSVSHVRDFNGDGVEDVIVGATGFDLSGPISNVGKSYVIYGTGPNIFKDGFE